MAYQPGEKLPKAKVAFKPEGSGTITIPFELRGAEDDIPLFNPLLAGIAEVAQQLIQISFDYGPDFPEFRDETLKSILEDLSNTTLELQGNLLSHQDSIAAEHLPPTEVWEEHSPHSNLVSLDLFRQRLSRRP